MTSTSGVLARQRGGLRRQWRRAFFVVAAALLLALVGVTATYLQTASRYQSAARHLDAAITKTSQLNAAVNDHEIQSHKLWQGTRIDRAAFLRGQNQISGLFRISQRDLRGAGEQALVTHAWHVWQEQLTSRGLWGAEAGPRRGGVTAAMQAAYGSAQDEVYFTLGQLSLTAIRDGGHDLAEADRFQKVGILLLVGLFALVLSIMVYFARRLTNDIVRPIETLQAAAKRLTEGFLDHRIELAKSAHSNEIEELADCFNEMASALSVSHQELERRATVDGLTGLANRASFSERLTGHVDSTDRRSETVSVLFVDIDDFKFVNDSIGHAAGDALLVAVAERLVASVRPSDYVARLGGDEFAIIVLGDEADASPSESVAERVLAAFTRPFTLGGRSVAVAVSVGASTLRSDTLDSGSLVSEADFAMYTAKRAGKGRREVFHATVAAN